MKELRVACGSPRLLARVSFLRVQVPFGVWIDGAEGAWRVLTLDCDGELWVLAGAARRGALARWCLECALRVYASLASLVAALRAGLAVGLLPRWLPGLAVRLASPEAALLLE